MAAGDSFIWIGSTSGDWSNPANWSDVTKGQTPAATVPGANDSVTVTSAAGLVTTISGSGAAANLTFAGNNAVTGLINAGTIITAGTLTIESGGTVDATHSTSRATPTGAGVFVSDGGTGYFYGIPGAFRVDGTSSTFVTNDISVEPAASIGGLPAIWNFHTPSALSAANGGSIQLAAAPSGMPGTAFLISPTGTASSVEIGTTGGAKQGALTFDSGLAATVSNDFFATAVDINSGTTLTAINTEFGGNLSVAAGATLTFAPWTGPGFHIGGAVVDGLIAGTQVVFETSVAVGDPAPALTGSGTVEAQDNGTISITETVGPGPLTLKIDNQAKLNLYAPVAAGNTISLAGADVTLFLTGEPDYINTPLLYSLVDDSVAPGLPILRTQPPPTAPLPSIGAAIAGFASGDQIVVEAAGVDSTDFAPGRDGHPGTLTLLSAGTVVGTLTLAGDYSHNNFAVTPTIAGQGLSAAIITVIPCFAAGTRIATSRGPVRVEDLREGDMVETISGQVQAIQWIGRRTIDCRRHPEPERVLPIRIAAHAFGENRPVRTVHLSPDHAVFMENVLIPIKFLTNEETIVQIGKTQVTYFHIELAHHDVVLAEGLPVETYLETGARAAFENGGEPMQLHPDFADRVGTIWRERGYAPLLGAEGQLDRVRALTAWQAIMLRDAPKTQSRSKAWA